MMGQLDVLHSSRHVVVAIGGATVAESSVGDGDDVAWTYTEPLRDAAEITGRIAFFNERVDLVVAIPGDDA